MAGVGLGLMAIAFTYAFHVVFSRSLSQDEGYLMITIQSFIEGHPLYDSVFTQYGPFYYFYEWILHALLAIPLTHDATRFLCMVHWLGASAILGLAAWRITRSTLSGAVVFMQAVVHLTALASEPGHPQELVVLLLALGMLLASGVTPGPGRVWILAVITALLAFTKINVGIFFGLALFLALRCVAKDRFSGPAWTWLLAGLGALLPLALMRGHLDAEWCRHYALIAAATVTAVFVLAKPSPDGSGPAATTWIKIIAGFLAPAAVILVLVAWTGTSPNGLLNGLLLTPLKMPGVALLPLPLSKPALLNAVISLALALALLARWKTGRDRLTGPSTMNLGAMLDAAIVPLKGAFGLVGILFLIGDAKAQFAWLYPWIWLVLVPAGLTHQGGTGPGFPRIFLALTAAWQGLQAYPIAGTQVTTATFLLPLAFVLCLSDALAAAPRWEVMRSIRDSFMRLAPGPRRLARMLGLVGLLYLFANLWCHLASIRDEYASLPALDLPGSRLVHMDPETTGMYRELAAYLEAECDTFVTYPGINSLYFWTGKRPPTHLNSTGWGQLSHAQQDHILTSLRQSRRPLLVVVAAAAQSWSQGAPPPILPLVRCVTEDCREVKRIGRFILFVPTRSPQTAQRGGRPPLAAAPDLIQGNR